MEIKYYRTRELTGEVIFMQFPETQRKFAKEILKILQKQNRILRRKCEKPFNYQIVIGG